VRSIQADDRSSEVCDAVGLLSRARHAFVAGLDISVAAPAITITAVTIGFSAARIGSAAGSLRGSRTLGVDHVPRHGATRRRPIGASSSAPLQFLAGPRRSPETSLGWLSPGYFASTPVTPIGDA
jgi:hypothetical protein